jgi:hypothetical protein
VLAQVNQELREQLAAANALNSATYFDGMSVEQWKEHCKTGWREAEAATARADEISRLAKHGIPNYAYGDNEAACDMSSRLDRIAALAAGEKP